MDRNLYYAQGLSKLIQCPTVSSYDETDISRFYVFHDLLRTEFPNLFSVVSFEDFHGSFLLRWNGKSSAHPILFMNHHDVVEAPGQWQHEPFSGDIADGKVWGRGTLDTKGGLYCMLQAAEELVKSGFVPAQDIYFESACTEECSGNGADLISQELEKRGIHFAFSLDEGGMVLHDPIGGADADFAMVAIGEKGCADIRFVAHSLGGHASRPGKNTPLVRLAAFVSEVENSRIFIDDFSPSIREMLRRVAPFMTFPRRFVLGHPDLFAPILKKLLPAVSPSAAAMMHTTLAFTMASGSQAANVLPQEAWIMGNMRYSPHQGYEGSMAEVLKIANKHGIEVQVVDKGRSSPVADFHCSAFQLLEKAVSKTIDGVPSVPYVAMSASDNRFMSRVADVCLGFTPFKVSDEQLDSIHGLNENIDIPCLSKAVDFYKFIMQEYKCE